MSSGTKISPQNVHESISRYLLGDVFPFVLDIDRSHGNYLWDSRSDRELLDCFSFIASNPLGFNHPALNDAEFEKRLLRCAKIKPSNSDLYTVEMAEFVDTFAKVARPPQFKHLFFVEGGTLAVENALKAAFDWKIRSNWQNGISGEVGTQVIHFREGFHGRSGYSLSLTNTADPRKTKLFPKFPWPRIVNPKCKFPLEGDNLAAVIALERQAEQEIRDVCRDNGPDIAALIVEPIQGEGGDNHFRPEFHQTLRRLADEFQFILIYDEVQSGVGLTGRMWAYLHYGIVPDMVTFGKKMQVCGFMSTDRVDSVADNVFVEKSRINSTWGGSLVDMVRATRYLEVIEGDRLVENAESIGSLLQDELGSLTRDFSGMVSNARGKGLMCAFDLPTTDLRDKFVHGVRDRGAIVLACGLVSVRLRPALTFSQENVAKLASVFRDTLKAL